MKKLGSKQEGISLVEAVLAILIISVGITGFLTTFSEATRYAVDSEFVVVGSNLANEQIEIVLSDKTSQGYDYITGSTYTSPANITIGNMTFTRTISVYEVSETDFVSGSPGSGFKRIDVTVAWGSTGQNVGYSTIVADY